MRAEPWGPAIAHLRGRGRTPCIVLPLLPRSQATHGRDSAGQAPRPAREVGKAVECWPGRPSKGGAAPGASATTAVGEAADIQAALPLLETRTPFLQHLLAHNGLTPGVCDGHTRPCRGCGGQVAAGQWPSVDSTKVPCESSPPPPALAWNQGAFPCPQGVLTARGLHM